MDISLLILQLCTLLVAVLTSVLTFRLGKGTNKIHTVFKQRAANKEKVQRAAAVLLKYSMKDILPLIGKEEVFAAAEAAGVISSVLKWRYNIADHIISLSEKLVSDLAQYVNNGKVDDSTVLATRLAFFDAYSRYDMAEWRFLKDQANGETRGSDDYQRVYDIVVSEFEDSSEKHATEGKATETVGLIGRTIVLKQKLLGLQNQLNIMYDGSGYILPQYQGRDATVKSEIESLRAALKASEDSMRKAFSVDYKELAKYLCDNVKEPSYTPHLFDLQEGDRQLFALIPQGEKANIDGAKNINLTVLEKKAPRYLQSSLQMAVQDGDRTYTLASYKETLYRLNVLFGEPQTLKSDVQKIFNEYIEKKVFGK